jgi:hypothetical protein
MSTPLRERPDAPLGTLIFRAGLLPAETIENALEEGVKTGRRLGEILIERGLLQEEDLTRLLAGQKGLPFVSLRSERIDVEATRLLSEDQARLFSALPIRFEEDLPLVAVADPTNDVLNRNIREALGQDVHFVVAGRTELNEVIGEAYSGLLPAFSQEPEALVEAEAEPAPLRVDTSVPPEIQDAPLPEEYKPDAEPEIEPEPELVAQGEPEPEPEPEAEPVFEAQPPPPEPEAEPEPEPVPVYEPEPLPAYDSAPEPAIEPEPEPEPETELDPVAVFEAEPQPFEVPAALEAEPQPFEAPAPAHAAPPAPEPPVRVATEPPATQSLPHTNGEVPHDFEADAPAPEAPAPVEDAPAPVEHAPAPVAEAPAPAAGGAFRVSIRLTSGEKMTVAECPDIGEAKGYAKAMTKQLAATDPDDWPFVNGRFLKPDTIVSVDVEAI